MLRVRGCVLQDVPAYEALYAESSAIREKLSEKRAEAEAAAAKELTFAPKLLSKQLVKEGRVMKVPAGHTPTHACARPACLRVLVNEWGPVPACAM